MKVGSTLNLKSAGKIAAKQYVDISLIYPIPLLAVSLRRLYGNGPCIRVRRSSDNTEQDIYPEDYNGILNFVGSGSGFIRTWYDQSGNGNDLTQTTTANQPRVVNGGIIDVQNDLPCVVFDGSNDSLSASSVLFNGGNMTFVTAIGNHSGAQIDPFGNRPPAASNGWFFFLRNIPNYGLANTAGNGAGFNDQFYTNGFISSCFRDSLNNIGGTINRRGFSPQSTPVTYTSSSTNWGIGIPLGAARYSGNFFEFIGWSENLNGNEYQLSDFVNSYYGLY